MGIDNKGGECYNVYNHIIAPKWGEQCDKNKEECMSKAKMMRAFLAAVLSCGIVFALASCSTTYTVSYSLGEHAADDATAPESAEYAQGTEITLPAAPAAEEG